MYMVFESDQALIIMIQQPPTQQEMAFKFSGVDHTHKNQIYGTKSIKIHN